MKAFNLSEWALEHRSMVLFLILGTLIAGALSFSRLGRLEDPLFNTPTMTAIVVWPGASAQEIQGQVVNRIERKLQELDGIDHVRSFSRQGYAGITLWMKGGMSKKDLDQAWHLARQKISDIRQDLPGGVRGPCCTDEYTDVYSMLYAVQAPDLSMAELKEVAEIIKHRLQSVPNTNKVDSLGAQPERIYVEISTQRLAALGANPQVVMHALARQNVLTPSGAVDGDTDRVFVRVNGALKSVADVRAVPVEVGGHALRLSDIAEIHAGYEDPPSYKVRYNGSDALAIGVTMVRNANILTLGKDLDAKLGE